MQHPNGAPCSNESATPSQDPVVTALLTQETFDRAQLAWLMLLAARWGYEARVDEENSTYPPPPVFAMGRWFDQVDERRKADAAARLSRPGDFKGVGQEHSDQVAA